MKIIVVDYGTRKELKKILKTSYPAISRALNYETDTPLANKIRKAALNRGGKILETSIN